MSLFITFEGGEGSGKSTQIALLEKALRRSGFHCLRTREPGGSEGGEAIRRLLVSGEVDAWGAESETLLFYAARTDHVEKLIRPALASGTTVLCDRFADSTLVYQGIGKGLSPDFVSMLHTLTLGNFKPDLTLLLDIDPEEGLRRAQARRGAETRFEAMSMDFHYRIRTGFLELARMEPARFLVFDASSDEETLHQGIFNRVRARLR